MVHKMSVSDSLGKESLGKLLFRLTVPSILAQLVSLLYNIIDRIYIAHIPLYGSLAIAGLGITVPLISGITAFGNLVGMGGSPIAAIELGKNDIQKSEEILWNSFVMLLFFAITLTIGTLVFLKPLLLLFGATEEILPYAFRYTRIINLGNIFSMTTIALYAFLSTQGFNKQNMIYTGIGAVINIILDPIFIFILRLGIEGAAFATVISQVVSAVLILKFLFGKKTKIRLKPQKIILKIQKRVFMLGSVTFFMMFTESIINALFNHQLNYYGNSYYIALYSIFFTITQVVMTPIYGVNQGFQPIVSYNYGAKNYDRLGKAMKYGILLSFSVSTFTTAVIVLFPKFFVGIFTKDPEILEIASLNLRLFVFGRFANGAHWAIQTVFRALGNTVYPFVVMSIRKIILIGPLVFIIPALTHTGVKGVFLAESISDVLAAICALLLFVNFYKKKLKLY